jgi:hypothetical protein
MNIKIIKNAISIRDKYDIYTDKFQTHFASGNFFDSWRITLFEYDTKTIKLAIRSHGPYQSPRYYLMFPGTNISKVINLDETGLHRQCNHGPDVYDIYANEGRKYSIYKNNIQIAWYEYEMVTLFKGRIYTLIADNDCNADLMIAFCLITDNYKAWNYDWELFSIDFGRKYSIGRKFDYSWQPCGHSLTKND